MRAAIGTAGVNAGADTPLVIAPRPPRRRVQWQRARLALGRLIENPERTDQVFELIEALAGDSGERLFQRFLRHENGLRLLREKPLLVATLSDLPRLESLPEGSFGRAYAAFMREGQLKAEGLAEASDQVDREDRAAVDPDRDWFYTRLRDMHDLWHVLTGYGRDVAGETANLAFTYGQTRNRGVAAIVAAGALVGPKTLDLHWQRYLWSAWRRGARAVLLCAARYEELLPLPLPEARRRLGVSSPAEAHPQGILVFQQNEMTAVAR